MAPRVFEVTALTRLDAPFNYARWLTRSDAEAEDVVQDACAQAMRLVRRSDTTDARVWEATVIG